MKPEPWVDHCQKYTICIDSYDDKIPQGRVYNSVWEQYAFRGLIPLLQKMESWMDEQRPQAYTKQRKLSELMPPEPLGEFANSVRKGKLATYDMSIIFRQHSSWQGTLLWQDQSRTAAFRSVLELIAMIDSSLRGL